LPLNIVMVKLHFPHCKTGLYCLPCRIIVLSKIMFLKQPSQS
jgi:hypothetical protein